MSTLIGTYTWGAVKAEEERKEMLLEVKGIGRRAEGKGVKEKRRNRGKLYLV